MRRNVIVCFCLLLSATAIAQSRLDTVVAAFVFDGVTAFRHGQLLPLYQRRLGQPLSDAERVRFEQSVESLYENSGYLGPRVSVGFSADAPEVARVDVNESRIQKIRISGVEGAQQHRLQKALAPLLARQPVSREAISDVISRAEHTTGLTLDARVRPIDDGYLLLVNASAAIGGELTYSAEGSDRLGRQLVRGRVSIYNPLPSVEEIYLWGLQTVDSDGYRTIGAGLVLPARERDTIYLKTGFARAIPRGQPNGSDTIYRRQNYRLSWGHRLVDESDWTAYLNGGLSVRDYTRKDNGTTEVDEQLRLADLGFRALHQGRNTAHRFGFGGQMGVDALGARRRGTQADDDIDLSFQYLDAEYTYWRSLPADFSFRLDVAGQYSFDNLPYSQRFSIGGSQFARAYEPGEFSGDSGIGSKAEFRRGFNADLTFPARIVPYIYYGLATARENEHHDRHSAAAAGIGVRVLGRQFSAYAEYGRPLTVDSEYRNDDPRLTGRVMLTF